MVQFLDGHAHLEPGSVERDLAYDAYRPAHDTTQALILDGILGRRWHRVDPARALATH